MSDPVIGDVTDRRRALGAEGVLARFNAAEVLVAADVHVSQRLGALTGESDPDALLALALTVRAVRLGSTCLDLTTVSGSAGATEEEQPELDWPEPGRWLAAVGRSRLVAAGVLRVDEDLLYLDRYWREEVQVRDDLLVRLERPDPETDRDLLDGGVLRVYPKEGYAEQREAVTAAAGRWTTVLTGGPGTGKTATVAGLLAVLAEQDEARGGRGLRIALSAPTGKAAARLQESVQAETRQLDEADRARLGRVLGDLRATTLHRLLGSRYPETSVRFRHDRDNRLPHDVVVVDETSMVPLTMMARLLEAVRPSTRLVLVGDPDQLASVEAGAVLKDLVDGFGRRRDSPVVSLRTSHRFTGAIADLAQALRDDAGADRVLEILRAGGRDGEAVRLVDPDDEEQMEELAAGVAAHALAVTTAADAGDGAGALAALDRHRLLCAHREGPYGVGGWNRLVQRRVAELTGITHYEEWFSGRPVLVTANDAAQGLYNGDVGVTVRSGDRLRVVLPGVDTIGGILDLAPSRLPDVETVYAMTVHKSQGSQAEEVGVVLPPDGSPLLTHELFYTAVTRAEKRLRVVATEAAVRVAVERRVLRASGLARRLGPS